MLDTEKLFAETLEFWRWLFFVGDFRDKSSGFEDFRSFLLLVLLVDCFIFRNMFFGEEFGFLGDIFWFFIFELFEELLKEFLKEL